MESGIVDDEGSCVGVVWRSGRWGMFVSLQRRNEPCLFRALCYVYGVGCMSEWL